MNRAREAEAMDVAAPCQEPERKSCHLHRHCKDLVPARDLEAGMAPAPETSTALYPAQVREWFHLRRDFRVPGMEAVGMVADLLPAVMAWLRLLLRWEVVEAQAETVQVGTALVPAVAGSVIFPAETWVRAHLRRATARSRLGHSSKWSL